MVLVTIVALLARANGVAAEIYEWADDANNRHYANSLDLVPTAARATARLVVTDARPPADAEVSASNGDEDDRRQDQPPTEHPSASGSDLGFRAGWEAGYRVAVEEQPPYPAQLPVIVFESGPPVIVDVFMVPSCLPFVGHQHGVPGVAAVVGEQIAVTG